MAIQPNLPDEVAKRFPTFAALAGVPEIRDLLILAQAADPPWNSTELQLHIQGTKWYKSMSEPQRQWARVKLQDPGEYSKRMLDMGNRIAAYAQRLGIQITLQQVQWLANVGNAEGWDDAKIQSQVPLLAQSGKMRAGEIRSTQTGLRGLASDYGVPVSDKVTFNWSRRIAQGQATQEGFEEYARNQAKINHPYWEKQLDEGHSIRDLASPYIETAAQLLELAPERIDLTQPKWAQSFVAQDKAGARPKTMLEFQRDLMRNKQYGYDRTANARKSAFDMIGQLEETFGAR